jgi:hypothetical protein
LTIRNSYRVIVFIIALPAIFAFYFTAAGAASIEVPRISIEKAKDMFGNPNVVIIDVRTVKTWWKSPTKILNAVREKPGSVEKWAEKYPKNKTLILYCS